MWSNRPEGKLIGHGKVRVHKEEVIQKQRKTPSSCVDGSAEQDSEAWPSSLRAEYREF